MTRASDCATNNMPAIPDGPCDCGYLATVRRADLRGLIGTHVRNKDTVCRYRGERPPILSFRDEEIEILATMEAAAR